MPRNLLNDSADYSYRDTMREAIEHARMYADGDESMYTFPELDDDAFAGKLVDLLAPPNPLLPIAGFAKGTPRPASSRRRRASTTPTACRASASTASTARSCPSCATGARSCSSTSAVLRSMSTWNWRAS